MITNLVDLSDWKTGKQIIEELNAQGYNYKDSRQIRRLIEQHNKLYVEHNEYKYIAHGTKGYKLTADHQEITRSLVDTKKRALDQLKKYYDGLKAIGENINTALFIEEIEGII